MSWCGSSGTGGTSWLLPGTRTPIKRRFSVVMPELAWTTSHMHAGCGWEPSCSGSAQRSLPAAVWHQHLPKTRTTPRTPHRVKLPPTTPTAVQPPTTPARTRMRLGGRMTRIRIRPMMPTKSTTHSPKNWPATTSTTKLPTTKLPTKLLTMSPSKTIWPSKTMPPRTPTSTKTAMPHRARMRLRPKT